MRVSSLTHCSPHDALIVSLALSFSLYGQLDILNVEDIKSDEAKEVSQRATCGERCSAANVCLELGWAAVH